MQALLPESIQVHAAANLDAGLRQLERYPGIDRALIDFRLAQGPDGLSIIRQLQRQFGPRLHLSLMTGDARPELLSATQELGVDLLIKPIPVKRLMAWVQR